MYLADWNITPFKAIGGESGGLVGGAAPAANGLVFTQAATFNIDRTISVSHDMGLHQTDYWIEGVADPIPFAQAAAGVNDKPRTASHTLTLIEVIAVSGGRVGEPQEDLTIVADGQVKAGQVIYVKSSGNAALAEADSTFTEATVVGVATANGGGIPFGNLSFKIYGTLTLADWSSVADASSLTPGAPYYIDETTPGNITSTSPGDSAEFSVRVGVALSSTTLAIEIGEGVKL